MGNEAMVPNTSMHQSSSNYMRGKKYAATKAVVSKDSVMKPVRS